MNNYLVVPDWRTSQAGLQRSLRMAGWVRRDPVESGPLLNRLLSLGNREPKKELYRPIGGKRRRERSGSNGASFIGGQTVIHLPQTV